MVVICHQTIFPVNPEGLAAGTVTFGVAAAVVAAAVVAAAVVAAAVVAAAVVAAAVVAAAVVAGAAVVAAAVVAAVVAGAVVAVLSPQATRIRANKTILRAKKLNLLILMLLSVSYAVVINE
jgi:hypothetical protein